MSTVARVGEGGIRTCDCPARSASYRRCVPQNARLAIDAVEYCALASAEPNPPRFAHRAVPGGPLNPNRSSSDSTWPQLSRLTSRTGMPERQPVLDQLVQLHGLHGAYSDDTPNALSRSTLSTAAHRSNATRRSYSIYDPSSAQAAPDCARSWLRQFWVLLSGSAHHGEPRYRCCLASARFPYSQI
jgi:hypothetical protein